MSNKAGRVYFRQYRFMLRFGVKVFGIVPKIIRMIIWDIVQNFEGKMSVGLRYCILASMARHCGSNVFIGRGVVIKNIENLTLGNNVSIHSHCYIDAYGGVSIGDDVSIAHQSSIVSFEHTWSDSSLSIKYNNTVALGVEILSDVWIGCGVRVLDGARVNRRVIVAAGSVVKGALGESGVYGGVPARFIKSIN